jgi:hypothetical protein
MLGQPMKTFLSSGDKRDDKQKEDATTDLALPLDALGRDRSQSSRASRMNARISVRQRCQRVSMGPSYPRRQQYRRTRRAVVSAAASSTVGALALVTVAAGATVPAAALLLVMGGLLADARRWLSLAGRSRVGARSEDEVQRALARLEADGWRLRHSLPWRGRGDIDSVAIAPTGVAFAIETKTRTFDERHIAAVRRDGAVASPSPTALVPARGIPGPVRGAVARSGARRGWGADRVAGPPRASVARRGRAGGAPSVPSRMNWLTGTVRSSGGRTSQRPSQLRTRHRGCVLSQLDA